MNRELVKGWYTDLIIVAAKINNAMPFGFNENGRLEVESAYENLIKAAISLRQALELIKKHEEDKRDD